MSAGIVLTKESFVRVMKKRRSRKDRRRFVDWYLYSFRGSDGHEYRLAFEVAVEAAPPHVPPTGTHLEYMAVEFQY